VIAIMKAYTTRVGEGPFVSELTDEIGARIQQDGHEFGTTTGRPRRCGWLDLVVMQYSHRINHYTKVNITKLDVLSCLDEIKVAVAYKHKGEVLRSFPASLELLAEVEVIYETFPGWKVCCVCVCVCV
jgi:adenylosuccinate synthase